VRGVRTVRGVRQVLVRGARVREGACAPGARLGHVTGSWHVTGSRHAADSWHADGSWHVAG
jgi:hypothetical protein